MTDLRQIAINCTVRKHAYRQSNAGIVVSFLVHHAEMPADLATADLGTSYVMALVEVDENDQPKEVMPNEQFTPEKAPASADPPARAHKSWHEMPATQQSGVLCGDPVFHKFLWERYPEIDLFNTGTGKERVAEFIRLTCGVKTRADILPGTKADRRWRELVSEYRAWVAEPAVVA